MSKINIRKWSNKKLCNEFVDAGIHWDNDDLSHDTSEPIWIATLNKEMKRRGFKEDPVYTYFTKAGKRIIDRSDEYYAECECDYDNNKNEDND